MYAVVETGGKQHIVTPGETLKIDLIKDKNKGDTVVFDRVLMVGGENYTVGTPTVANAKVHAVVTSMGTDGEGVKGEKIHVFKYKRTKGYEKSQGHRQRYTEIKIDRIEG